MNLLIWIFAIIFGLFAFVVFFGAPYVPVRRRDVKKAFDELYPLSPSDVLVDLGSGDGRVLREVSKRGAHAVGIELNPILVSISRWLSRGDDKVTVRLGNLRRDSFPDDTTIVYLFATSRDSGPFVRKIEREATRLGRKLYVLSYGFKLPGHEPVRRNDLHLLYEIKPLQSDKHKV